MRPWKKVYRHTRTGQPSASLRDLYACCSEAERELSDEFFARYLAGRGTGDLTLFAGILQEPGPLRDFESAAAGADLRVCLTEALAASLPDGEIDLAVSGGIDCWLLAALLRSLGYGVRAWYLESGVAGYCEREQVQSMAAALGIPCRYIRVTAADFVDSLEEFVTAVETPIYNLHPVSKWLLAQRLRQEGVTTLVTGDGADQVMRREWDCDLLPLTLACFQHAGIRLVLPFTDHGVIAFCREPFPDKRPVRDLSRQLGVPEVAKHATLFPSMPLPGIKPSGDDRADCLSYTTGLLVQVLEEHRLCAGSRA